MRSTLVLIPVLFGLAACAAAGGRGVSSSGYPLLGSLQVTTGDGAVNLVFQVTNTSEGPIELNYRNGQSYDFEVRQGGRELWKWSTDRMFTQAVRNERLEAGASLTYEARWQPPPGTRGELQAIGRLTAVDLGVEQSTTFAFP